MINSKPESTQSIAFDDPSNCAKNSHDDEWHVMACVRLCRGDHLAGLLLSQLIYWWPRKRPGQKGVKKSVSDWQAELMLSRAQVERINRVLTKLGLIEIYQAPWGHFKSPSTFYVLTPAALDWGKPLATKQQMVSGKPLAGKSHVVGKPLASFSQVTETTKDFTEITEKSNTPGQQADPETQCDQDNPAEASGENQTPVPETRLSVSAAWEYIELAAALPVHIRQWRVNHAQGVSAETMEQHLGRLSWYQPDMAALAICLMGGEQPAQDQESAPVPAADLAVCVALPEVVQPATGAAIEFSPTLSADDYEPCPEGPLDSERDRTPAESHAEYQAAKALALSQKAKAEKQSPTHAGKKNHMLFQSGKPTKHKQYGPKSA